MTPRRMQWHEFAKKFQTEEGLSSYTDALKQAPPAWKKYKQSFSDKNPGYDHVAILEANRKERARKIASGELAPSKRRGGKKEKEEGEVQETSKVSNKDKKAADIDSDSEYDFVERVVTRKRKRLASASSLSSPSPATESLLLPQGQPKKKRTRKQKNPKEKVPSTEEAVQLPASSIKKKKSSQSQKGGKKDKLTYTQAEGDEVSSAQETEEDFIQEQKEDEDDEEDESEMTQTGRCWADQILY